MGFCLSRFIRTVAAVAFGRAVVRSARVREDGIRCLFVLLQTPCLLPYHTSGIAINEVSTAIENHHVDAREFRFEPVVSMHDKHTERQDFMLRTG